jgi:hypothetical protein
MSKCTSFHKITDLEGFFVNQLKEQVVASAKLDASNEKMLLESTLWNQKYDNKGKKKGEGGRKGTSPLH